MMRRRTVLFLTVAAACALLVNIKAATTRTMLSISDLHWLGMYQVAVSGAADTAAGSTQFSPATLAVRYVSGERRFLMPTFRSGDPVTGSSFGDLVEYRAPGGAPYTGSDTAAAPALVEVRRWKNWTLYDTTPSWQDAASG